MTQRRQHARFNYDQGHRVTDSSVSRSDIPGPEKRQSWDERVQLEEQARARLSLMRGSDQSVLLIDTLEGPFNNPADTAPTKTVLSFTVPQARVLVVNGIGWKLSDPFWQGSIGYEIELYVDGGEIPYWQDGSRATPGGTGFGFAFGSMPFIIDTDPIYVQSNSTLSVHIRRFDVTFVEFIAVAVLVRGWLEKPVSL